MDPQLPTKFQKEEGGSYERRVKTDPPVNKNKEGGYERRLSTDPHSRETPQI